MVHFIRIRPDEKSRYVEEVGELQRTYDDLTNERTEVLIKLEGLKRRKQTETEVTLTHASLKKRNNNRV